MAMTQPKWTSGYQTSDGQIFDLAQEAERHQDCLNLIEVINRAPPDDAGLARYLLERYSMNERSDFVEPPIQSGFAGPVSTGIHPEEFLPVPTENRDTFGMLPAETAIYAPEPVKLKDDDDDFPF